MSADVETATCKNCGAPIRRRVVDPRSDSARNGDRPKWMGGGPFANHCPNARRGHAPAKVQEARS